MQPITEGFQLLWPLLIKHGFTRALQLSTPSFQVPDKDRFSAFWLSGVTFIRVTLGSAYKEIVGFSSFIASQPADQLKWTLFRVPLLVAGKEGDENKKVKAGFKGGEKDGYYLSRRRLAAWALEESERGEWLCEAPVLSNE